jgi:hypothetical protein
MGKRSWVCEQYPSKIEINSQNLQGKIRKDAIKELKYALAQKDLEFRAYDKNIQRGQVSIHIGEQLEQAKKEVIWDQVIE